MSPVVRRFRVTVREPLLGEVDEAARVASVPRELTTKGMYFAHFVSRLGPEEVSAIWPKLMLPPRHGKYQPFLDYPFADVLLWVHAVARKAHPRHALLEALRLLGRDTVKVFLASNAGRIVKTMNFGPRQALLRMPEMWKVTDPQNIVTASELEPGCVRFEVAGFYGWIDCGLIGTLEQVVLNHHVDPVIDVELHGAAQGRFEVSWK